MALGRGGLHPKQHCHSSLCLLILLYTSEKFLLITLPSNLTREVLKVGDLAAKKSWSDQNLSEFSKVNLIGQI